MRCRGPARTASRWPNGGYSRQHNGKKTRGNRNSVTVTGGHRVKTENEGQEARRLLTEAAQAGLVVEARGGELVVREPASAAPLVERLAESKQLVLPLLAAPQAMAPTAGRIDWPRELEIADGPLTGRWVFRRDHHGRPGYTRRELPIGGWYECLPDNDQAMPDVVRE